jgi:NPL4 family
MLSLFNHNDLLGWLEEGFLDETEDLSSSMGNNSHEQSLDQTVKNAVKTLKLEIVGCIYTDVLDSGTGTGSVLYTRHPDQYFVSSGEILWITKQQPLHPYFCPWAKKDPNSSTRCGSFGLRFVTVIVSGNAESAIYSSIDPNQVILRQSDSTFCVSEFFHCQMLLSSILSIPNRSISAEGTSFYIHFSFSGNIFIYSLELFNLYD